MTTSIRVAALVAILILLPMLVPGRRIGRSHPRHSHHHSTRGDAERSSQAKLQRPDTVQVAGSSLPDCSHACGSCSPCRLVIVSFVCATLGEAETCPMAYNACVIANLTLFLKK